MLKVVRLITIVRRTGVRLMLQTCIRNVSSSNSGLGIGHHYWFSWVSLVPLGKYSHNNIQSKSKSDTNNNRGNWNQLKIIHKIPEQHTGKARIQGAAENNLVRHFTRTWKVLVLKYETFNMGNNITCTTNCSYRTAGTVRTLEKWYVSGTWL